MCGVINHLLEDNSRIDTKFAPTYAINHNHTSGTLEDLTSVPPWLRRIQPSQSPTLRNMQQGIIVSLAPSAQKSIPTKSLHAWLNGLQLRSENGIGKPAYPFLHAVVALQPDCMQDMHARYIKYLPSSKVDAYKNEKGSLKAHICLF